MIFVCILVLVIIVVVLVFFGNVLVLDKFKIGYLCVMDDVQVMVVYEVGFYKKYGLDVELIEFKFGIDLVKVIVGGQLDSGVFGFFNVVVWVFKGVDLKVVGGVQLGYYVLVVCEDFGINKVVDLKGKILVL